MFEKYPKSLIMIKAGNFYDCINDDAIIINKLFNYKIKELSKYIRVGFPKSSLNRVRTILTKYEINYITVDNNDVTYSKFIRNNYSKYSSNDYFVIKKTIELVRKTICNYSHEYKFLKDNIMNTFYDLLSLTYKANIYKDINTKKDIIVDIKMIEHYIKVSCDYQLISYKKFKCIGDYLLEINKMVYSWMNYEENR